MRRAADEKPEVSCTGKGLGVRIKPVNGCVDVHLDDDGLVIRNGEGLSVAPHWRRLPHFLIPERLKDKVPKARGSDELHCFRMGDGEFADAALNDALEFLRDGSTHGVIAPRVPLTGEQFQERLANTRQNWDLDEE
jgi:hypothetical protein